MLVTRRHFLVGSAAIAGFSGITFPAAADTLKLRYNRWLPATHHIDLNVYTPWFKEVASVTDGRVEIDFTASSLAPVTRQYEIVSAGIVDLSFGSETLTPGRFPLSEIMELPFLGSSCYANSVAYWRVYKKHFEKTAPYRDVKLLGLSTLPPYHLYTTKKPVRSVADLQGMKIRATGTALTDWLRAVGATAVPASVTELHDVLSRGIVDGMLGNDDQALNFSVTKYFRYKTEFPGGVASLSSFFIMNKDKWNSISAADQAKIDVIAGERHASDIGRSMDKSVAAGSKMLKDGGCETIVADKSFVDDVRDRTKFLEERWLKKASGVGVDGAAALADFKKLLMTLES